MISFRRLKMNSYVKFAPNVWVAKCSEKHNKGDIIPLTSSKGKTRNVKVHNLVKEINGVFYYSFTREDGLNSQDFAKRRAERYEGYKENALKRSSEAWEAAQEGREFLSLGEPIKVGHHSEKKHRALIERNNKRMDKSVEEMKKAESYDDKIRHWEEQADKIDLSMPESLPYFEIKYQEAKERHQFLKDNKDKREHSMSLSYANKRAKEMEKMYKTAQLLWA